MIELISLANLDSAKLIKDVVIRPLKVNADESGVLVETLRSDWSDVYEGRPFAMQYYSKTPSGMARDEATWHFHPTVQDDRFEVISGAIVVAVADYREDSETYKHLNLFYIQAEKDPFMVVIPKRTLHGFMVVSKEPAILVNFPTGLYNPEEEGRIPFTEAGITLPDGTPFAWNLVREYFNNI